MAGPGGAAWGINAAALALALLNSVAHQLVNQHVPEPYMDEPFHVGQTQQYCAGNYASWDPKITTFPGLYVIGTAAALATNTMQQWLSPAEASMDKACSTGTLRALNASMSVLCLFLLHAALRAQQRIWHRQWSRSQASQGSQAAASGAGGAGASGSAWTSPGPAAKQRQAPPAAAPSTLVLWALALAFLPLHWSYSYLYYTDIASTFYILLCHLYSIQQEHVIAALAGCCAVACRQTNAVWVAFCLGASALKIIGDQGSAGSGRDSDKKGQKAGGGSESSSERVGAGASSGFLAELGTALGGAWRHKELLVMRLWPMALVPAAFVAFVVYNKGIVVGDREAHKPVQHPAQLVYFAPYAVAMLAPALLPAAAQTASAARRQPAQATLLLVVLTAASAAALHFSPPPHPYLLADNRHYTFYLWRKLLGRSQAVRFGLVAPVSAACWALLGFALLRNQPRLWLLGLLACTTAVLLPAWLLEFRYFTVPLLMIALHLPTPSKLGCVAALAGYAALNAATLYVFLFKPYTWADGSEARFMW